MLTKTWNFAQRSAHIAPSIIREILKLTLKPEIISFAGGLPSPDAFPMERIREAAQHALDIYGTAALQYGTTEGFLPLREWIAARVSQGGRCKVDADQVLITSGSQQALDLIGKIFLDPGDFVALERPTYLGALQAFNAYQAQYLSMEMDDQGVLLEGFEATLKKNPKFAYLLPNYQNPSGILLSEERRAPLAKMAEKYGVPLIEDDAYWGLRFWGEELPNLYNFAPDNTLYVGTFSKTLAPGFRLAFVVGEKTVISKLVQAKQAADLHTPTFVQTIAYEALKDGFLESHSQFISKLYGERCNRMLEGMDAHFPKGLHWVRPQGGMFVWVTLPEHMNALELFNKALEQNVAFVPGTPFYADGTGHNTLRLNFSHSSLEQIEDGIERLGKVLHLALEG
jgi:2-aminoadipate transaminase